MRSVCALVFAWLLLLPSVSLAVADDFTVRAFVGQDTSPPTTPIITSTVPVASSQIDISWDPSTDDNELTGYLLSRDGTHIATTTQTSFSDTGLAASTTYSYTVRAYDWRLNISSSSDPVATTTLDIPPPPTPTPRATSTALSSGSGRLMFSKGVVVTPDTSFAVLDWETTRPSRFMLRWGRTDSYELGFVSADRYREVHQTEIMDLEPGTRYYYELVGFNTINDIPQLLDRGSFTTLKPVTVVRPANVYGLFAKVEGDDVVLSWQNPPLSTGATVRVVRNYLGYPIDPYDGMVIYQGVEQTYRDRQAFTPYDRQFYTVFVIDGEGNVSSGAIVRADREGGGGPAGSGTVDTGSVEGSGVLQTPVPDIVLPRLDAGKILITQGARLVTFADPEITLDTSRQFTIAIPRDGLPPHLKSIIVTLIDPSNNRQAYTFLLRLNVDETAYEATLAPVLLSGLSRLTVEVIDFTASTVGRYSKAVTFIDESSEQDKVVMFPDAFVPDRQTFLVVLFGVIGFIVLLFLWLWRRRQEDGR